jgi:hypothetical protein
MAGIFSQSKNFLLHAQQILFVPAKVAVDNKSPPK